MRLKLDIPRLRLWHLIALVATVAAFLATFQFRRETEDPGYREIRRLRSADHAQRARAAAWLGAARPASRRAIGPLTEALFDEDAYVRTEAAESLGSILKFDRADAEAPAVMAALARGLADPDPRARRAMIVNLARFEGDPKLVVPALLGLARSGSPGTIEAFNLLGSYARRDESARAFLFAALEGDDAEARLRAIDSLSWTATVPDLAPEPYQASVRAALAGRAGDGSSAVRGRAIGRLARLATPAGIEPPEVIEALADPASAVRAEVAYNLAWRKPGGHASPALVSALGRLLDDPDPKARMSAATTLGMIGLDAVPTLPGLRAMASDPEGEEVRAAATGAIIAITGKVENLRALKDGLDEPEAGARAYAASQLGKVGPGAAGAVPTLIRLLDDADAEVRRASADALGRIGAAASPGLDGLDDRAGTDGDEGVRKAAAAAARSIRHAEAGGDRSP